MLDVKRAIRNFRVLAKYFGVTHAIRNLIHTIIR